MRIDDIVAEINRELEEVETLFRLFILEGKSNCFGCGRRLEDGLVTIAMVASYDISKNRLKQVRVSSEEIENAGHIRCWLDLYPILTKGLLVEGLKEHLDDIDRYNLLLS